MDEDAWGEVNIIAGGSRDRPRIEVVQTQSERNKIFVLFIVIAVVAGCYLDAFTTCCGGCNAVIVTTDFRRLSPSQIARWRVSQRQCLSDLSTQADEV